MLDLEEIKHLRRQSILPKTQNRKQDKTVGPSPARTIPKSIRNHQKFVEDANGTDRHDSH